MSRSFWRRQSGVPAPCPGTPRFVSGFAVCLLASLADGPASAQALVGDGSIQCGSSYQVESGDTLSRLAARAYGDPLLYGFIADANWSALGGDPENIAIGMKLALPCVDASGQVMTPEGAAEVATSMAGVVAATGPLSPEELDILFGPVALFPDEVLTPVLVAATFPLDVVKAARFVDEAQGLADRERADRAVGQPWDDSVRALAAGFPTLVNRMSDNIDWTEQAGEAVVAQTDAVLEAIQRLRAKARDNGYLVANEAQTVEAVNDKIVIAAADPNVVYVPTYDSAVVYAAPVVGSPVYQYGYDYGDDDWIDWNDAIVAGGIVLGGAVLLDDIFDDDDWNGWDGDDVDWDRGDITIDRDEVNIDVDRGDVDIGDREIGDRERISIGDSERIQVDRGEASGLGDRRDGVDPRRAAAAAAGGASISNAASREAARQRIEARSKAGAQPAELAPARQGAAGLSNGDFRASAPERQSTRATSPSRPTAARSPQVSRPSASRPPAKKSASRSTAFQKPAGSHRASAASARGHSSKGGRSGGARRK